MTPSTGSDFPREVRISPPDARMIPAPVMDGTLAQATHTLSHDPGPPVPTAAFKSLELAAAPARDATLSADIQRALDGLPTEFRTAVVLCDVAGLPYQEIAESLGVPVGTVRSRIHRGRALLRKALA